VLEDFAIVARVHDTSSNQEVVAVGGIGTHGTLAGGEFLTTPEHLRQFAAAAPAGWRDRNIELVIATTVVEGTPGPPRVVAVHYWD
jgi:hypothetical protein